MEALKLFGRRGGILRVREKGRLQAFRYVLFNKTSPLLSGPMRSEFLSVLDEAAKDRIIHENCIEFFELLLSGLRDSLEGVVAAQVREIVRDEELSARIWKAVVSREIQYRMQYDIRQKNGS